MHSQVNSVQAQHVQHVKQAKAGQRTMTYAKSQATSGKTFGQLGKAAGEQSL